MKLYDTLSRKSETLSISNDSIVRIYVCGITPYAPSHVGHAMNAVVFDVLRRYLEFKGYSVRHVQNFTDIDDKMIKSAEALNISIHDLAEKNIEDHLKHMETLNVLKPHVLPRATQEIPKIIEVVSALLSQGFAYESGGDVYFRVRKINTYGKLSHRSLDSMMAGARVEIDENKEYPMDFVLWKSKKLGEPSWDSPWGPGRPGWHIECSAMSLNYLGDTLDIHGGGQDLIFPHHENEIAQTEAYSNTQTMSRFWVHNGLLRLKDEKMSKSIGNFVTVNDALKKFSSDALRLFFVSSHYRSPLTYDEQIIIAQERAVDRLRNAVVPDEKQRKSPSLDAEPYKKQYIAAMEDDLNTPRSTAVMFDLAHEINRTRDEGRDVFDAQRTLRELAGILGLTLSQNVTSIVGDYFPISKILLNTYAELRSGRIDNVADQLIEGLVDCGIEFETLDNSNDPTHAGGTEVSFDDVVAMIEVLINTRANLRELKQYDLADSIRQKLYNIGIILEDALGTTGWKRR